MIAVITAAALVIGLWFYREGTSKQTRTQNKIESIEQDKSDLVIELESLRDENKHIKEVLNKALDSIELLSTKEAETFIIERYIVQEAKTNDLDAEPAVVVIDSVRAVKVVKDLVQYDASKELLANCRQETANLSEQLELTLRQNELNREQAERYRRQRNLYSIPIVGNILGLPNFIQIVVN